MINKYISLVLILSSVWLGASAQKNKNPDLSKRLYVGDTFKGPTSVKLIRSKSKTIDWKKLENKVVLLDFFATTCTICIATMPKLQELKNKQGDILEVIVVSSQSQKELTDFFNSNSYLKERNVNLPVIYEDSELRDLFPHRSVPTSVLLYQGKVQAITTYEFITSENIRALYEKGSLKVPFKNDFGDRGDLANRGEKEGSTVKVGTFISGYQDGVPPKPLKTELDSLSGKYKTSIYNYSTLVFLRQAWGRLKKPTYIPRPERIIWKVNNPYLYDDVDRKGNVWLAEHAISYERYDRVRKPDTLIAKQVFEDLYDHFGIRSYFDQKEIDCLVLRECPVVPWEGGALTGYTSYEGTSVLATMLDVSFLFPPAVDLVNREVSIKIGEYHTIADLNKYLRIYGIEAKIEKATVEVFVVEEDGYVAP